MTYEVDLGGTDWKIVPSTKAEEIIQNVKCLLLTAKGTCFFYRDFGIEVELVDKPLPVAKNKFLAEVVVAIEKYEPRARVKRIKWVRSAAADGVLSPVISIEI